MNNKKPLFRRALKAGIFTIAMFSTTQSQALSMIDPIMLAADPAFPMMIDEVFITADVDGNQKLSVNEFYQLHATAALLEYEMTFKRMDNNGSGDVDSMEFTRFLPNTGDATLKEQFLTAAGDDAALNFKEFALMRTNAQNNSNNLLWKFAMLDHDHDGELTPAEFYGLPMIEPPIIIDPIDPEEPIPEVIIDPPAPPITPIDPPESETPVDPTEPEIPEAPVDPAEPEMPDTPEEPTKPEIPERPAKPELPEFPSKPIMPDEKPKDHSDSISETAPIPDLAELIAELNQKLAALEKRISRIGKSISRTQEKLEAATSDRKTSRLEKRLKRQAERLDKTRQQHEETVAKLQELEQMTAS